MYVIVNIYLFIFYLTRIDSNIAVIPVYNTTIFQSQHINLLYTLLIDFIVNIIAFESSYERS